MNLKEVVKGSYKVAIFIIPLTLLIIHGFDTQCTFTIDDTTVLLMLIMLIPFLMNYVDTIKFGGMEASFKKMSTSDKELFLIKELAREDKWTFFTPRSDETHSGSALLRITDKLKENNESKFNDMLKELLDSDDENQVWFASEVIGYYQLENLKSLLESKVRKLDFKKNIVHHKLNCLWAVSRFNLYKELIEPLQEEINEHNKKWIIEALIQMLEEHISAYRTDGFEADKKAIDSLTKNFDQLHSKNLLSDIQQSNLDELKNSMN